jgi:nuclear mRNA export protein PCID2/THP1
MVKITQVPTLVQFLGEISKILRQQNAAQLQDYLVIEPPYGDLYNVMITELRNVFPKDADQEDVLEEICSGALPEAREGIDGATWTAFIKFIVQYFIFIRDVNIENLLDTYNLLSELVQ